MSNWRKAIEQYRQQNQAKIANQDFFSTNEAVKILNIQKPRLLNWVKLGKVTYAKKVNGTGKMYFEKELIYQLKERLEDGGKI